MLNNIVNTIHSDKNQKGTFFIETWGCQMV